MTVCRFWKSGYCRHGDDCWHDHFVSSSERSASHRDALKVKGASQALDIPRTADDQSVIIEVSPTGSSSSTSDLDVWATAFGDEAATEPQHKRSSPVKGIVQALVQPSLAFAPRAMSSTNVPPESADASTTVSTTMPSDGPKIKVEPGEKNADLNANEAELREKIAGLEANNQLLRASLDPERQSLKNEILREELTALTEKNSELRIDAKAAAAREAGLRAEMATLKAILKEHAGDVGRASGTCAMAMKTLQDIINFNARANECLTLVVNAIKQQDEASTAVFGQPLTKNSPNAAAPGLTSNTSALTPIVQSEPKLALGLFGNSAASYTQPENKNSGLFGAKPQVTTQGSIFSNLGTSPPPMASLFSQADPRPSLFGSGLPASNQTRASLFDPIGTPYGASSNPPPETSLFNQTNPKPNFFQTASRQTTPAAPFLDPKSHLNGSSTNPPSVTDPFCQANPKPSFFGSLSSFSDSKSSGFGSTIHPPSVANSTSKPETTDLFANIKVSSSFKSQEQQGTKRSIDQTVDREVNPAPGPNSAINSVFSSQAKKSKTSEGNGGAGPSPRPSLFGRKIEK